MEVTLESGGLFFTLKDIIFEPALPALKQKFTISGKVELLIYLFFCLCGCLQLLPTLKHGGRRLSR